jgi:hypothetical protein
VEADVAALGLLLLQLITGDSGPDTEAMICDVEDALEEDRLLRVVDINAGNWPRHVCPSSLPTSTLFLTVMVALMFDWAASTFHKFASQECPFHN